VAVEVEAGGIEDRLDDSRRLPARIESAYTDRERLPAMGAHNQVKCRQWSWDMIARETAKVYRQCLSGL